MSTNVEHQIKAGKLIITIDISPAACAKAKDSASGKTKLVASTHGSVKVDSPDNWDLSYSLNLMAKPV